MPFNKKSRYTRLFKQLEKLLQPCNNPLTRMATINAVLYHKMDSFSWVGFYLLHGGELTAGPYQGPLACQLLEKNRGVCWAGINQKKPIIVQDGHEFPGHIACDSRTRSEIVIPLKDKDKNIIGVFDVDSRSSDNFDEEDGYWLELICNLVYMQDVTQDLS